MPRRLFTGRACCCRHETNASSAPLPFPFYCPVNQYKKETTASPAVSGLYSGMGLLTAMVPICTFPPFVCVLYLPRRARWVVALGRSKLFSSCWQRESPPLACMTARRCSHPTLVFRSPPIPFLWLLGRCSPLPLCPARGTRVQLHHVRHRQHCQRPDPVGGAQQRRRQAQDPVRRAVTCASLPRHSHTTPPPLTYLRSGKPWPRSLRASTLACRRRNGSSQVASVCWPSSAQIAVVRAPALLS